MHTSYTSYRVFVINQITGNWTQVFESGNMDEAKEFAIRYLPTLMQNFKLKLCKDIDTWS